jgi:hypothetical protein
MAFDSRSYWLMPHGLTGILNTVFWPGAATAPRRRIAFPIRAPAKDALALGEHSFWRGVMQGRTVALQGDNSVGKYDLFEEGASHVLYWGTFRGNGYYGAEESHAFAAPFPWLANLVNVGDVSEQSVTDTVLEPHHRTVQHVDESTFRTQVVAHYDSWRDPDSGTSYRDVLEMNYWSRYPEPASREVYWLGNGLGTLRFETFNPLEPSGVHYQYAERFEPATPPDQPARPWYDPFKSATHVRNGYCEDFLLTPVQGGEVGRYLRGWSGSPDAVITTDGGDPGTSPWKIALRGANGGGDTQADFVVSTDWIPATPGARYRLSGSIWRVSARDNAYLDFNDGLGQGGNFPDAQALARGTQVWERVAAETTLGPATTAIRVRFVRDGASEANAYCDGITLQRVD